MFTSCARQVSRVRSLWLPRLFDRNFLVPAHADELRQAVRIVGIGFVDLHRQCRLGVQRIDAHHWQTEFPEPAPVPGAQLPGLEPNAHRVRRPRANGGGDDPGRGYHRAAPHDGARRIDDAGLEPNLAGSSSGIG
jgi:hypothetical protein